jgi:uncharacterized protein YjbI with pentapeptide repeats
MTAEVPTFERIFTALEKQELRDQLFRQREFAGVDLAGADLRGTSFVRTAIASCNLEGADLRGVHFIECDLHAVVMRDAVLGENRFDGTVLSDVVGLSEEARISIEHHGGAFLPLRASHR